MRLDYNIKPLGLAQGSGSNAAKYEITVWQPCGVIEISFWDKHPTAVELEVIACQCTGCKAMTANAG
jgi:hypothetical protein